MRKRIFVCIIGLLMCFTGIRASAVTILDFAPADWSYAANGSAQALLEDGCALLRYDAGGKQPQANAEVDTAVFSVDTVFTISFALEVTGLDAGCQRTVSLRDAEDVYSFELLRTNGAQMTLLGDTAVAARLTEGETRTFSYTFDLTEENRVQVTLDGTPIYDGSAMLMPEALDMSQLRVRVRNFNSSRTPLKATCAVQSLTVSIPNDTPNVAISGCGDGAVLGLNELCTVTVAATDETGIARVELYLDDQLRETFTSAENQYALPTSQYGYHRLRAVAYDLYDAAGTAELDYIVTANVESQVFFEDFTNIEDIRGTDNDLLSDGILCYGQAGYYETTVVDGNKCLVLATEGGIPGQNGSPWCGIPVTGVSRRFTLDMDLYLAGAYRHVMDISDSLSQNLIEISDKLIAGGYSVDFPMERWNHITIKVDMDAGYDVILNGETVGANIPITLDHFTKLRMYGNGTTGIYTRMGLDNIRLSNSYRVPQISGVVYTPGERPTMDVRLTDGIQDGIAESQITVQDQFGSVSGIAAAEYRAAQKTLRLTLTEPLRTNARVDVSLSPDTTLENGTPAGIPIRGSFTTDSGTFEVVRITPSAGGAALQVVNQTGEERNLYAFVTRWKGTQFIGADIQKFTVDGDCDLQVRLPETAAGERLELYVRDGLVQGKSLYNREWSLGE